MKKLILIALAVVLALAVAACNSSKKEAASTPAATENAAPSTTEGQSAPAATENATEATMSDSTAAATEVAETHDCAGCGMKDLPMDKLTLIDGKYYCATCAAAMKSGADKGNG